MTFKMFLVLLTVLATVTSLVTEAVKKFLDSTSKAYASNVVVLIVAIIVGGLGMVAYYVLSAIPWTAGNIVYIAMMIVFNWLGAMLGYDKVIQAITQIKHP